MSSIRNGAIVRPFCLPWHRCQAERVDLKGSPLSDDATPKRRADPDDKSDGRDDDDALLCRRLLSSSHGPKSTVSAPSQKSVSQSVSRSHLRRRISEEDDRKGWNPSCISLGLPLINRFWHRIDKWPLERLFSFCSYDQNEPWNSEPGRAQRGPYIVMMDTFFEATVKPCASIKRVQHRLLDITFHKQAFFMNQHIEQSVLYPLSKLEVGRLLQ